MKIYKKYRNEEGIEEITLETTICELRNCYGVIVDGETVRQSLTEGKVLKTPSAYYLGDSLGLLD